MGSPSRWNSRKAGLYWLAWTALALFFFTQDLTRKFFWHDPTPWWHYLASWITGMYILGLVTPAILWVGQRFPFERKNWGRRVLLHLVFSMAFSIVHLVLDSVVISWLGILPPLGGTFRSVFAALLVIGFHGNITAYWTILGIQYGVNQYRRYQEREQQALRLELQASELQSQLMRAHLSALKMQLQPHFLFNTLNAIMVLVRQQQGRQAEDMLARLSDLLRCVLEDVEAQEVPLRRELEYVELYLSIEQVRFRDRLRVEVSVDPEVLEAAVPHMALQPIVENAIRHGIGRSSSAGRIEIRATREGQTLHIEVQDDGPGLPESNTSQGRGIGLANTRARLHQLYGGAASLSVENAQPDGVVATLVIPYHVAAPGISETEVAEVHAFDHADR